jgi:hypothetical protein
VVLLAIEVDSCAATVVGVEVTMDSCAPGGTTVTAGEVVVGAFLIDSPLPLPLAVAVVKGGEGVVIRTMGDLPGDRATSFFVGDTASLTLLLGTTGDVPLFRRKRILLPRLGSAEGVVKVHDGGNSDSNVSSTTIFSSLSSATTASSDFKKEEE